jgi:hypothetical protein
MKKALFASLTVYTFFLVSGSLHGVGEKTFVMGAASGWNLMEKRTGVTEIPALRPYPVLALSSARPFGNADGSGPAPDPSLDLALSFDEGRPEWFRDQTGRYRVSPGPALRAAESRWARSGAGAALFTGISGAGEPPPLVISPGPAAQFSPGRYVRDFSIEFWLYPQNMENGEQILGWTSSKPLAGGEYIFQRIQCIAVKNRLRWDFLDFFTSPGGDGRINISLNGSSPLAPKSWSHHLIRFDADTGLLEYLVNGTAEAITHATPSAREGGQVYIPIIGGDGSLSLGSRFMGLMDEFRIYRRCLGSPSLGKYPLSGGRAESRPVDLGEGNSGILKVEAFGGRAAPPGQGTGNEYSGGGELRFRDGAALQFFIRAADSPYHWTDADWRPFIPGGALPEDLRGRFVQVAADFYPSGNGESTPYLDELRIVYRADEPPVPPALVSAFARDGAVELSWKASPERDVAGYLVYYGVSTGEYFGDHAAGGASPLDAGNRTSLRIEGLENGTLYYFAVAAYDRVSPYHPGEFSREASARPLRGSGE